jgi:hypothetical protein
VIIDVRQQHDFVGRHRPYTIRAALAALLQSKPKGNFRIEQVIDATGEIVSNRVIAATIYSISNRKLRTATHGAHCVIASWKEPPSK